MIYIQKIKVITFSSNEGFTIDSIKILRKEGTDHQKIKGFTSSKIIRKGRYKPPENLVLYLKKIFRKVGTDHQKLCATFQSIL
jgi:hypothetical protein